LSKWNIDFQFYANVVDAVDWYSDPISVTLFGLSPGIDTHETRRIDRTVHLWSRLERYSNLRDHRIGSESS